MTYIKKISITFLLIFIIFVVLKFTLFSTKIKVNVYQSEITISTSTIKVGGDIISYNDGIYKTTYYFSKDKKKLTKLFPEKVFMLKKYQKTNFETTLSFDKNISSFDKNVYLTIYVEEILPKNILRYKKVMNLIMPKVVKDFAESHVAKTLEKPILKEDETIVSKEQKIPKENLELKKEVLPEKLTVQQTTELSDDNTSKSVILEKKDLIKESLRQVKISTKNFLPEYFYDEIIETKVELKNISNDQWRPKITILLKNNYGIIITSNVFSISLNPNETTESKLQLKVSDFIISGEYEIEYFYLLNNKKYSVLSPKFKVSDRKPKIMLTELPKIRIKTTNTILAEITDDRGITSVQFVEIDIKTLKETFFPMTLIAGDRKFGLYSYTTAEITKKGVYKFYIKVEDVGGNIATSEIYEVQITK